MLTKIPPEELAMFWKGRAAALRQLDKAARDGNEHARSSAEAYEECAAELEAALTYGSGSFERIELARLAKWFGVTEARVKEAQDGIGLMYRQRA